jgi:hypothetical protein
MRIALLAFFLTLAACGNQALHGPIYHSPLLRSEWDPLVPRPTPPREAEDSSADDGSTPAAGQESETDPREAMIGRARALMGNPAQRPGYGAADVSRMLGEVIPGLGWEAGHGLQALVDRAGRAGAFDTDGDPEPGDIVLFHNQVDANGNGEADDWLSGCGVVVERHGPRFTAVVRTGHAPREVVGWPDGPNARIADGRLVNSFLRVPHRSDPAGTQYLTGALYAGHIDIDNLAASAGDQ